MLHRHVCWRYLKGVFQADLCSQAPAFLWHRWTEPLEKKAWARATRTGQAELLLWFLNLFMILTDAQKGSCFMSVFGFLISHTVSL
jgi:hypothetical protein